MSPEIKTIKHSDKNYPPLLREIPDAPEMLYIKGEFPSFELPWVSIVGTRKATPEGILFAKQLAKELSEKGFIIVSGLAMGIDTAAHEGTLKAHGKTVAVLGNGLDEVYPRQNENLAKAITSNGGALISEYSPETPAYPNQFLERNRIVSGMCQATIVIEAPDRSGSLVTARLAAEYGRDVFIFPGPAAHPNFRGSHKLIRDGARLVTNIEDILEDLGLDPIRDGQPMNPSDAQSAGIISNGAGEKEMHIDDPNEHVILNVIERAKKSLTIDKISELTKLDPAIINQILTFNILKGAITEDESGYRRVTD